MSIFSNKHLVTAAVVAPVLAELAGKQQIVAVTNLTVLGLDPKDGEVLWSHEYGADDQDGAANAMFVSLGNEEASMSPSTALETVLELEDLGLLTEWHDGSLLVESTEYVLRPPTVNAISRAAGDLDAHTLEVTSYLATGLIVRGATVPYSTVSALAGIRLPPAGILRYWPPEPSMMLMKS